MSWCHINKESSNTVVVTPGPALTQVKPASCQWLTPFLVQLHFTSAQLDTGLTESRDNHVKSTEKQALVIARGTSKELSCPCSCFQKNLVKLSSQIEDATF